MFELLLLIFNLVWAALTLFFLAAIGKIYLQREQLPGPSPRPSPGGELPKLSIIIPARDEAANIGECVQCITQLDYPEAALEIIVVDDNSNDATASIVKVIAARDPRVQIISAGPLPEGWMGKSHACWQGVKTASGEWLLFVDADTYLKPTAARAALDYALRKGHEFFSVNPFQRIVSVQERLALPGVFLGFASAIDFDRVNDPDDSFAIANGQFLLFSREAYTGIGGHEAIRAEVSDDLAFARAAKRHRISSYILFGEQYIETRMYRSLREVWNGFSKNAIEVMHSNSVTRTVLDALMSFGLAAGMVLPVVMLCSSAPADATLWKVSLTICLATFATLALIFTLSLRALRVPVIYAIALPFGLAMHGAIIINAYFRHKKGKRVWKGRHY